MKLSFKETPKPVSIEAKQWASWTWQMQASLQSQSQFDAWFGLSEAEKQAFLFAQNVFNIRVTPYYASVCLNGGASANPLRRIFMPSSKELAMPRQALLDPLAERRHSPVSRIVHRYADRVLFLATDICSVYCRFCTRKHFTGGEQALIPKDEYQAALKYITEHPGIREVILSGGDPLTLSDGILDQLLSDIRAIDHVEIIRIGSRMPVVNPMRITTSLALTLRKHAPVFVMSHFNHPRELTAEAKTALANLVDNGVPVMNQMVLLNGVNNHPAIVQALSRRLLYLRVKPYYMFQCDPSEGTDHLRTSVEESMAIQRELWGHLSGLALPHLSLDIPDGGGKVALVPNFEIAREEGRRTYRGFDGAIGEYVNPPLDESKTPEDAYEYIAEWEQLKSAKAKSTAEINSELNAF